MARFTDIELDEETVTAARAGRPEALAVVYSACGDAVYTLIRRLVRRPAVAEDLLQETFADVLEHIGDFEGRSPLPMWVRAIAVRRSLMYLRSPWHRSLDWLEARPEALPSVPGESARVESGRDLETALMALPALTRAVIWLHDVEGYTHQEIAAGLGRSVGFSKSQLSRGHARLRRALGATQREGEDRQEGEECTPASTS